MAIDEVAQKVGKTAESIIDSFLKNKLNEGLVISETSKENCIVDRVISNADGIYCFLEHKARRMKNFNGVPAFSLKLENWHRTLNFVRETRKPLGYYILDGSPIYYKCDYKPRVIFQTVDAMFKETEINGVEFPAIEKGDDGEDYIYFPAEIFKTVYELNPDEIARMKKVWDEFDAARGNKTPSDAAPPRNTLFEETPVDNVKSEPKLIGIDSINRTIFRIPNPFYKSGKGTTLSFARLIYGDWLCKASNITYVLSAGKTNYSEKSNPSGAVETAVRLSCKEKFTTSADASYRTTIWLRVEDVANILNFIQRDCHPASYKKILPKFQNWWSETIIPHLQNGTMEQIFQAGATPKPSDNSTVTAEPKFQTTPTHCDSEMSVARQIYDTAIKFKGYGANGNSLIMAINYIKSETKTDITDLIKLLIFGQSEPLIDTTLLKEMS